MITIWNAKAKIAKMPPYQAEAMLGRVALGAYTRASSTPRNVSSTAKTCGSGINRSKRKTKSAVARLRRPCLSSAAVGFEMPVVIKLISTLSALKSELDPREQLPSVDLVG